MQFESFSDFINMGGYAPYVWISYALAFVVLVANIISPWRGRQQKLREIARKARRAGRTS
jgi:heme exporter protein D